MTIQHPLSGLIADYQKSVLDAVVLMQRSGIRMPAFSADWVDSDTPRIGELEGGIRYYKHGAGCEVRFATGAVDFDFGERGEIDGFDAWRLSNFAGGRLSQYGFDTVAALKDCFEAAVTSGFLVWSGHILYYVADAPRMFATDIDSRLPGDDLPPQSQDRVFALYAHCFLAADLMRKNYEKFDSKWKKRGQLSRNDRVDLRIYMSSWLGYLRATCEGFERVKVRLLLQESRPPAFLELVEISDELGKLMKQHREPLRKLRNSVFHLHDDASAVYEFFESGEDRLSWARELHRAFARFFSNYRVYCEVHYMVHNRITEMDSRQERPRRRSRSTA